MSGGTGTTEYFFAVCPRGAEPILAAELLALGAEDLRETGGGVGFAGTMTLAYAANLHSRCASRILWWLAEGDGGSTDALYALAQDVSWEDHFSPRQSLRVDINATRSPLTSLDFALLRVKDGIVDRMRDRCGERPSIDRAAPEVRVFVHLDGEQATLYFDLSGEALFKRGWRRDAGEAPLKENLAAALLALSGWGPGAALMDPFCGSGTFLIEAALVATRRAPGLQRAFAFERLIGFDRAAWRELREEAEAAIDDRAGLALAGSDIDARVLDTARANARTAGLKALLDDGRLRLRQEPAAGIQPIAATGWVVTNPPYGERLQTVQPLDREMRAFADNLKQRFAGWQAWVLSSDLKLPGSMRLKETRRTVVFNGPLECRFFRFDLVAGGFRRPGAA